MVLSVWAPGALRPSHSVPHFDVPQPDLLRCLKVLLAREIEEMSLSSPSPSPSPSSSSPTSPFLSIQPPKDLLKHQRDTVDDLHQKDELALEWDGMPRRSHFFCLPTGAGKLGEGMEWGKEWGTNEYIKSQNNRENKGRSYLYFGIFAKGFVCCFCC